MFVVHKSHIGALMLATGLLGTMNIPASAAVSLAGRVQAGGSPVAGSTVTLWAASAAEPRQLAQTRAGSDGRFNLRSDATPASDVSLYLTAAGGVPIGKTGDDNAAIAFLTVLGNKAPPEATINELTTVVSVWTHNQFIDGTAIKGHPLSLKIAAGNVPSFVALQSGGWGTTIQDPLNSGQTPTMANFATLANVLAGCATRVIPDACSKLYGAVAPPTRKLALSGQGTDLTDTLTAAQSIAQYPWYKPERLFALMAEFYPVPEGKTMRPVPFMPYLGFPPSAWVLPPKFDGGGYRAGGKAMFDSEGNLWVGDNFTIGWQGQDKLWQGNATKFDPNGKPLSPLTTGFAGGGMQGGTFGNAVDGKDNAWFGNYGGKSIAAFDKNGKPLTPPEGITFDGKLGLMQGIIATPSGDVFALGVSKNQLVHFPKGDWTKGRILCEGRDVEPCKSFLGPFHLGIDQQDRIWVTNALGGHVTRFPASDPSKAEKFSTGWSGSGLGIDSQGNVLGSSIRGELLIADLLLTAKMGGNADERLTRAMAKQTGRNGGSVTLLRPDGSEFTGSPFSGGGLPGPWAATIDGNDNVWVSNFAAPNSPLT